MKNFKKKDKFFIYIFLTVVLFSLLGTIPLYLKISDAIKSTIVKNIEELQEKTGLLISYDSISPSVLTGIKLNSVSFSDLESGKRIFEVNSCLLEYNLLKIFSRKPYEIFQSLVIDGLHLDFDKNTDFKIFENLKSLLSLTEKEENPKEKKIDFSNLKLNFPFDVTVKNIEINYSSFSSKYSVLLRRIGFDFRQSDKSASVVIDGNVFASVNGHNYSGKFLTNGVLRENFTGSSLIFRFSNISDGDFNLARMNLLFEYTDDGFSLKTVQNNYPLFISAFFNPSTKDARLSFKTNNLTVSSLVTTSKKRELSKKLKNLSVSISLDAFTNISEKKLSYSSSGKLQYLIGTNDVFSVLYDFSGDEKEILFSTLNAESSFCKADFSGGFDFKNFSLFGFLDVKNVKLKSGLEISSEIYFDRLEKGFMAFSPQVFLGEKIFTALEIAVRPENDSFDFDFEISDYAHEDSENPGLIEIGGSFIPKEKYFQVSLDASNLFLDSIAQTALLFVSPQKKMNLSKLKNYVFNGEFYASSDLETLTFNVPYAYAANVKSDDEFLYLSIDGNNNSLKMSRCDYIKKGKKTSFQVQLDRNPGSSDFFMGLNFTLNSIPYYFTGSLMPGVLNISGDYGTNLVLYKSKKNRYDGSFSFENLPVSFGNAVFSCALDSALSFTLEEGINVQIANFSVSETTSRFKFYPKFSLKGEATSDGIILNEIIYSDIYSTLSGNSVGTWQFSKGVFEAASFEMSASSEKESVSLDFKLSNPELKEISGKTFMENLYINSQIVLNNFNLNRFSLEESENNAISASLVMAGSVNEPYIGLNVSNASVMFTGNILSTNFTAFVEDKKLSVSDFYLKYNNIELQKLSAGFDFNAFEGNAETSVFVELNEGSVTFPVKLTLFDAQKTEDSFLPKEFKAKLESHNINGSIFKNPFDFEILALCSPEKVSFSASDYTGITGEIFKNGDLTVSAPSTFPVSFDARGNISSKELFINVSKISVNLSEIFRNLSLKKIDVPKGFVNGQILITGLKSDPYFQGKLLASSVELSLPLIVSNRISIPFAKINVEHNEFILLKTSGKVKKDYEIFAEGKIVMDRWKFDHAEANISTYEKYFPCDLNVRVAQFTGLADLNLDIYLADGFLDVSGDVKVQKTKAKVLNSQLLQKPPRKKTHIRTDLNIFLGPHVNFQFDPILRCLFAPDSEFKFKYSEEDSSFSVDGVIELKSGDIAYLNRNFYLKSGTLKFNENDPEFNPIISVKAETREKDENGHDVTIIMSVENQSLLDFSPVFSSIPAKSETEIRTLLGEIVKGDSDSVTNLFIAASDYALQSLLGRSVENKLRDFLNFDILSIRTLVLQNAFKSSFLKDKSQNKSEDLTIGNLLDNSTVYIGKYIGSDLYLDALMHWSYDESRQNDFMTPGGLVFKPEIGLEIETPFANIKWKMAPEFTNVFDRKLVSSTSVTLSWKFSF